MKWMQCAAAATLITFSATMAQAQSAPPPEALPPAPAPGGPVQDAPPQANLASGTVSTNVNLRRGPGTNYNVITLVPAGAAVVVGDCNGGWCQVSYQGQDGYVIATSLGQASPAPSRSAAAGPPPPGYPPDEPVPVYVAPPPYYGPYYPYAYRPYYYGYGPYYGGRYWRRHW